MTTIKKFLRFFFIGAVFFTAGCDAVTQWKGAATRAIVSFIPRKVDNSLGEIAEKSQTSGVDLQSVPSRAQDLIQTLAQPLLKLPMVDAIGPRIRIVKSPVPNAYAFPHGGVFVTSQLLLISETPDEILAVLAHEFAHVVQRHSMQLIVTQVGTSLLIQVLLSDLSTLADIINSGGQLLNLKFSRDHEREADTLGAEILRQANLPLSGLSLFFQRMQQYEKSKKGSSLNRGELNFLSTHPPTQERINFSDSLVSSPHAEVSPLQRQAYLQLKTLMKEIR